MARRTYGYLALDVKTALDEIYGVAPSERRIREYAKKNGLAVKQQITTIGASKFCHIIPENKLEKLLEGMNIPVRVEDVLTELESIRKLNIS